MQIWKIQVRVSWQWSFQKGEKQFLAAVVFSLEPCKTLLNYRSPLRRPAGVRNSIIFMAVLKKLKQPNKGLVSGTDQASTKNCVKHWGRGKITLQQSSNKQQAKCSLTLTHTLTECLLGCTQQAVSVQLKGEWTDSWKLQLPPLELPACIGWRSLGLTLG